MIGYEWTISHWRKLHWQYHLESSLNVAFKRMKQRKSIAWFAKYSWLVIAFILHPSIRMSSGILSSVFWCFVFWSKSKQRIVLINFKLQAADLKFSEWGFVVCVEVGASYVSYGLSLHATRDKQTTSMKELPVALYVFFPSRVWW